MTALTVYWSAIGFILYSYVGYPLALLALSMFRKRRTRKEDITPIVSVIITAYNEESRISEKIQNTLNQDYPRNLLEVIVASDASTDRTDAIVLAFEPEGVRLIRVPKRGGKEAAQKLAVEAATGEILVFSDAATILAKDGIRNIVKNFADLSVGCVSSVDRYMTRQGSASGESMYVRYEMMLRNLETSVNTIVGLSGSFFAARKSVCHPWHIDLQSDFNTLLNSVKMSFRGVSDPQSVGYYREVADERQEFERKVRTVVRGMAVLMENISMLNPIRYGLVAWQLLSHKLCRWLVPVAMVLAFVSNLLLIDQGPFYVGSMVIQSSLYLSAVVGSILGYSRTRFVKVPAYLVMVNLSILYAWVRYLKGERILAWESSKR